ncbi:MAG: hypothetical protein CMG66_01130 [Candidatus Marinimicrobia bacterium]|nr:hypothetical protein [Candidatus Neomarinimicrobiota bacterium]|tara:strand:+ start:25712 stop:26239 length:528 start_codon:yes stop_codon:yes gene_type:complete
MNIIKYKESIFEKYISNSEIIDRCQIIGEELNDKYLKEEVVLLGLLDGCLPFMKDLSKFLKFNFKPCFVKISSYKGFESGDIKLESSLNESDIYNKNVIVIDDIIDTGKTICYIRSYLENLQAKKIKIASLLVKDSSLKLTDWFGFKIDDEFVIGYGMDLDNQFRDLKHIYIKKV